HVTDEIRDPRSSGTADRSHSDGQPEGPLSGLMCSGNGPFQIHRRAYGLFRLAERSALLTAPVCSEPAAGRLFYDLIRRLRSFRIPRTTPARTFAAFWFRPVSGTFATSMLIRCW